MFSNFYVRKLYINFINDAVALKCVTLTLNTYFAHAIYTQVLWFGFESHQCRSEWSCYLKVVLSSPESRGILECCPDMQAWLAPRKDEEMACGAGY